MVRCPGLRPSGGRRQSSVNRGRSGIAGFVEMFCVGQADHGFVKRRGLGCNGSLVQGLPVVGRTEFKGKMRFELRMEDDGVVPVAEGFQTLNQCIHPFTVALQKRQRVLNQGDAYRHRRPYFDAIRKTDALQETTNPVEVAFVGFVKQSIVKPLNRS